MNLKTYFVAASVLLVTGISCSDNQDATDSSLNVEKEVTSSNSALTNDSAINTMPGSTSTLPAGIVNPGNSTTPVTSVPQSVNGQPSSQIISQPAIVPSTAKVTATGTGKGLNPAHGQPGHRCDIEVGVPLNSPAKTPSTAPAQQITTTASPAITPNASPSTPVSAPSSNATGKINPAHGQPGHDCKVAVGAPLP